MMTCQRKQTKMCGEIDFPTLMHRHNSWQTPKAALQRKQSFQKLHFPLKWHKAPENRNTEFFIDFNNAYVYKFFVLYGFSTATDQLLLIQTINFTHVTRRGEKPRNMSLETLIDVCHLSRLFCWFWSLDFTYSLPHFLHTHRLRINIIVPFSFLIDFSSSSTFRTRKTDLK